MEINPRLWGGVALPIACGVDFPWLSHRIAMQEAISPITRYTVGKYSRNLSGDVGWFVKCLRGHYLHEHPNLRVSRAQGLRQFAATMWRPTVFDQERLDDLGPLLWSVHNQLRRLSRSIGHLLRSTPAVTGKASHLMIEFLKPDDFTRGASIHESWKTLAQESSNLQLLYQSPEWWWSMCACDRTGQFALGIVKRGDHELLGVVPVHIRPRTLDFNVGARKLLRMSMQTVCLLGSQPLLREDSEAYEQLFRSMLASFPECACVEMYNVPSDTFCWNLLMGSSALRRQAIIYLPEGVRPFHVAKLPATFDEYLRSQFQSKTRYNLQRQVRLLREHGGGVLNLVCVEREADLPSFLEATMAVWQRAWQYQHLGSRVSNSPEWRETLVRLAATGNLRCYLLNCGDNPCAFMIGHHFRGVFHNDEMGFKQDLKKMSPGTVLLYLVIKDLIERNPCKYFDFGTGDAWYKRQFASVHLQQARVLLLRKTLVNRLRCCGHATYRMVVSGIKRLLRRRTHA
jgi:CelD/BcsL family acetyltransferase involved in cellulose biosynthesis